MIKHGGHKHAVMFISLSKCDYAGEMRKIGAFPPKLSIGELFEEKHGNYDPKLYKIKVSTSIGNQSYDPQFNLTLSGLTANFKGANNITVTSSACSCEDTVCTNNHKFIYSPKRCYCYKISSALLRVRASLKVW